MATFLHHPPHILINDSWYFITAHTVGNSLPLKRVEAKNIWIQQLSINAEKYEVRIVAYVVLDNHYHLLCYLEKSANLPDFISRLHGSSSYAINKAENKPNRRIWHNYWDRIIRDETDFYTKINYIHYNPVKHGYVANPEDWCFSTYRDFIEKKGNAWVEDCWRSYPVIDFNFES